jgi:hypothetical protein
MCFMIAVYKNKIVGWFDFNEEDYHVLDQSQFCNISLPCSVKTDSG